MKNMLDCFVAALWLGLGTTWIALGLDAPSVLTTVLLYFLGAGCYTVALGYWRGADDGSTRR